MGNDTDLEHKVAIITGGSGGIGQATGRVFAAAGASVLLVDLDEEALAKAVVACESDRVSAFSADVSDPAAAQAYVQAAVDRYGGVDICFANAGTEGKVAPLVDQDPADVGRVLDVNVKGVWLAIKYAVPKMIERGGGSFIATSSVAGFVGAQGLGPYVASKHAVVGLVKTAAIEYGKHGVRVNSIHPGPIDNRMMDSIQRQASPDAPDVVRAGFESQVPMGRYGLNEEIANLALFLAGTSAGYCTGAQFVADGGYLAG